MEEQKQEDEKKKKIGLIIGISIIVFITMSVIIGSLISSKDAQTTYYIGEQIKNKDGVTIQVTNVENTKQLGNSYLADTTSGNFVVLTIKITNTSNKAITIYGGCVDLYNSNGVKYEEFSTLNIEYILSEDINVGLSRTFQVAFETTSTTLSETYTAKIGYSMYTSSSSRVNVVLKNK